LHNHSVQRSKKVDALIHRIPVNGGSRASLGAKSQLKCHKKVKGFFDVYGRMAWGKPSPTITSGCINPSKGRFLHPVANRAITLREAALLQSFPLRYKFPVLQSGKYPVALLIGNALPPEFIRRQALHIRRTMVGLGARKAPGDDRKRMAG
jgi:DNA (cytosine-5)-methyltransferase 1